jgi:hypothetical protein
MTEEETSSDPLAENKAVSKPEETIPALTTPVRLQPSKERDKWISSNWTPFLERLEGLLTEIKFRTNQQFAFEVRLPSQEDFRALSAENRKLTEQYYGRANVGAVYTFLVKASEVAGIEAAYAFSKVPSQRSADNWVLAMDGSNRSVAFANQDRLYAELLETGTMEQKAGQSDIDATVLPNVLDPGQAKVLLGSSSAKLFVVNSLRSLQKSMLKRLAVVLKMEWSALLSMPAAKLRLVLSEATDEQLSLAKIRRENPAFVALSRRGTPVQDFGQMDVELQKKIQRFIGTEIQRHHEEEEGGGHDRAETTIPLVHVQDDHAFEDIEDPIRRTFSAPVDDDPALPISRPHWEIPRAASVEPPELPLSPIESIAAPLPMPISQVSGLVDSPPRGRLSSPDSPMSNRSRSHSRTPSSPALDALFSTFLKWLQENPGRYFHGSEEEHKRLLVLGLWTDRLAAVRRSVIEKLTLHRYVSAHWTRTHESLLAEESGKMTELRPKGAREHSRFRKNAFPYAPLHGLGLLSGGIADDPDRKLLDELGCHLDPGAKTANWYNCDIEKIAVDAAALSPLVPREELLPGDCYLNAGQNPRVGSSIGATLHTHVVLGSAAEFPVFCLRNCPVWCEKVGAEVDVIQVSDDEDAFYVRLWIGPDADPAACGAVGFLIELRRKMVSVAGRKVDFVARALPDPVRGGLILVLVPIGDLWEDKATGGCVNKLTGETTVDILFPVPNFDLAISGGAMLIKKPERWVAALQGRPAVERVYSWARYSGARNILAAALEDAGYVDSRNGKTVAVVEGLEVGKV